jgi:hypothetical protein
MCAENHSSDEFAARERSHRGQIERLNQRGGRMLSIVDLIEAGTIGLEMAAYAWRALHRGSSLLTGARPGGAGKTTVMAALLDFLPPQVSIDTIEDSASLDRAQQHPDNESRLYLAHEIGSGYWYAYIWGDEVARFFGLIGGNRRIASCLHADTLEETAAILTQPQLGVSKESLQRVGLALFMWVDRQGRAIRRRVNALYARAHAGSLEPVYAWNRESDRFARIDGIEADDSLRPYVAALQEIVDRGEVEAEAVRRQVLEFYQHGVAGGQQEP